MYQSIRGIGVDYTVKASKASQLVDSNFPHLDPVTRKILGIYFRDPLSGWTEDSRREIGQVFFDNFLEGVTYDQAYNNLSKHWKSVGPMPEWFWTVTAAPAMLHYNLSIAGWYECGFPRVLVEGEYGSALMATRLTEDVSESIIPPWPYFILEVQDTPLLYQTKNGVEHPVNQIFVRTEKTEDGIRWNLTALCGDWEVYVFTKAKTADLIPSTEADFLETGESVITDLGSQIDAYANVTGINSDDMSRIVSVNARMTVAATRLVLGACLAMADPTNIKRAKPKFSASLSKHTRGLPAVRTFLVGRPLKLKCRDAMTEWVAGGWRWEIPVRTSPCERPLEATGPWSQNEPSQSHPCRALLARARGRSNQG